MKPQRECVSDTIEGAAKVDDLVGTKPENKIGFKIPSFAPRIVQLVTAKGRTVK